MEQTRNRPKGLSLTQGKILNALRAGPLESDQLQERFGEASRSAVYHLGRAGYVNARRLDIHGSEYRITPAGLNAIPPRSVTWEPTL